MKKVSIVLLDRETIVEFTRVLTVSYYGGKVTIAYSNEAKDSIENSVYDLRNIHILAVL